ncbi:MAG: aldose epimerase family protein [Acutalibacteraceae bacterium]|nr:aldose epimerase family protein [Acutalibacteraceae bacterium]
MNKIEKSSMGNLSTGEEIFRFRLYGSNGAYCDISDYGGCITNIILPDKNGKLDDIIIGYDTVQSLEDWGTFFGKLVGRYANRIGNAEFSLNGEKYTLEKNNGENHLHGGSCGFHKKIWNSEIVDGSLVLTMESPDGEGGFPGKLSVKVTYTFDSNNTLRIEYEAVADKDTPMNFTNHAFFNLGGLECETVREHEMLINADYITSVSDRACIPDGKLYSVENTPFDFRKFKKIGDDIYKTDEDSQLLFGNGYDHNYVMRDYDKTLKCIAVTKENKSGRVMETYTDLPGVQFYSGNGLGNYPHTKGKKGVPYVTHQAFCLETQFFPDSVNNPQFPSCIVKAGDIFKTVTEYRFSVL